MPSDFFLQTHVARNSIPEMSNDLIKMSYTAVRILYIYFCFYSAKTKYISCSITKDTLNENSTTNNYSSIHSSIHITYICSFILYYFLCKWITPERFWFRSVPSKTSCNESSKIIHNSLLVSGNYAEREENMTDIIVSIPIPVPSEPARTDRQTIALLSVLLQVIASQTDILPITFFSACVTLTSWRTKK